MMGAPWLEHIRRLVFLLLSHSGVQEVAAGRLTEAGWGHWSRFQGKHKSKLDFLSTGGNNELPKQHTIFWPGMMCVKDGKVPQERISTSIQTLPMIRKASRT